MDKRNLRPGGFWLRGSRPLFAAILAVMFATSLADSAAADRSSTSKAQAQESRKRQPPSPPAPPPPPPAPPPALAPAGNWLPGPHLNEAHGAGGTPTLTLLQDGRVLLVGGNGAEIYDPATNTWRLTEQRLSAPRFKHTATLLTNGRVLIAGGTAGDAQGLATAELFDPETGTWSATGNMSAARVLHSATLLPNGLVLVAGGCATWE